MLHYWAKKRAHWANDPAVAMLKDALLPAPPSLSGVYVNNHKYFGIALLALTKGSEGQLVSLEPLQISCEEPW